MRNALAAALLVMAGAAHGEEARWYTQIDNDSPFYVDRWYTSGVRVGRVQDGVEWSVLQEVYTPDAKRWDIGKDERIPVGRLLIGRASHTLTPELHQTIELALGVRGPASLGRQAAELVHRVIPAPDVDWSRQLENEVDAQFTFVRSQRLGERGIRAHYGAVLGNQMSYAHAGLEVRTGVHEALSSPLLRYAATPPFDTAQGWSAYAGVSVRVIGHNELISRNYDPRRADISPRRGVARGVAGLAWTRPWGAMTFELALDSREFDAQHSPHRFGSFALHFTF